MSSRALNKKTEHQGDSMGRKKEAVEAETTKSTNAETLEKIQSLLFKQVERPSNTQNVKIINVFNDNYRINVWTLVEEDGLTKNKIHSSYMTRYKNGQLEILLPKPSLDA